MLHQNLSILFYVTFITGILFVKREAKNFFLDLNWELGESPRLCLIEIVRDGQYKNIFF